MLDYIGILNMYVNHAIVVIWVFLRAYFDETKVLFSAFLIVLACGSLKIKYITYIIIYIVADRVAGHIDTTLMIRYDLKGDSEQCSNCHSK